MELLVGFSGPWCCRHTAAAEPNTLMMANDGKNE
jgi:hypothetical protein